MSHIGILKNNGLIYKLNQSPISISMRLFGNELNKLELIYLVGPSSIISYECGVDLSPTHPVLVN